MKIKEIVFKDHPEFRPNLTPKQMFELGSFGGTYWRPIYSTITKKSYKDVHKKNPEFKKWFKNIPESHLSSKTYDKKKNRYGVKVGTTLEMWEERKWITKMDPYGWVQWYCNFFIGRRTDDDERQIKRWQGVAGKKGRFSKRLINMIKNKGASWDDETISPKIRQTLQHWAFAVTKDHV